MVHLYAYYGRLGEWSLARGGRFAFPGNAGRRVDYGDARRVLRSTLTLPPSAVEMIRGPRARKVEARGVPVWGN